jgi:excisionase family DNA binding protein
MKTTSDNIGHHNPTEDIFTLTETARYLKVAEKTVQRMIKRGEIPAVKVGSQYRFIKSVLDDWLVSNMNVVPKNDLAKLMEREGDIVPIYRLVDEGLVIPDLRPAPPAEILERLIKPLVNRGIIKNGSGYLAKLLEREKMASTATPAGIAFPHIRKPADNPQTAPVVVIGICRSGTIFDGPAAEPVRLFFLPCTDSEVVHLRILQKLARIVRIEEIKDRLMQARSTETVLTLLFEAEKILKE